MGWSAALQEGFYVKIRGPSPVAMVLSSRPLPAARPSQPFLEGLRACLPALPGVLSFGVISGVAMTSAGLPAWVAMLMSLAVFAGTAQLAALQLAASGTPLAVILFAAIVINLRFVLYSLAMSPYLRGERAGRRAWAAYLLSDNGFGHFIARYGRRLPDASATSYFLGMSVSIWLVWQAGTLAGALLGAQIPPAWSLEFTVTLVFVALAAAHSRDRATLAAALTGGAVAALAQPLPYRLGLILGAAAGIAAGLAVERWRR